ncbi:MAG: hypothetical protein FK734_16980 [Asgard group archaeon]|nr:hypothetical protein [Asgard group archaeon]
MTKLETLKRSPLHLDYFRDDKNRICQVFTWHHPEDRILSIIKYDIGESFWVSRETGIQYKRILKSYSLEGHQDNLNLVKKLEPDYSYHSIVYNVDFLAVPVTRIIHYYYPEKRLEEIMNLQSEQLDEIEKKVKTLAELLHDHLKIPFRNMGITGSIVWKGQTKKSDIDFMIYGNQYAQNFNDDFSRIYDYIDDIKPMNESKCQRYEISMAKKSGLPLKLTKKYITIKKWLSVYNETNLSFLFSPTEKEIPFKYGEQIFSPIEPIIIKATIDDTAMGWAYPAIYNLTEVQVLSKSTLKQDEKIKRVLSFEGALTGYFKKGNEVVIRGLLERVSDKDGNERFYQIILGTKECVGNEFIIFYEDFEKL